MPRKRETLLKITSIKSKPGQFKLSVKSPVSFDQLSGIRDEITAFMDAPPVIPDAANPLGKKR